MSVLTKDLQLELDILIQSGQPKELIPYSKRGPARIEIKGKTLIDYSSWDFLGASHLEQCVRASQEELGRSGTSTSSARTISGTTLAHTTCEKRLAEFFGMQSALLFSSRNQVLFSLITSLCNERDIVIIDEYSQAPTSDAAYLVNCQFTSFSPTSPEKLILELERSQNNRRRFVFAESLGSHTGRLADLPSILEICARFDAHLILDESYAVACLGNRGAGVWETLPISASTITKSPHLVAIISDLGTGVSSYGACLSSTAQIISLLAQRSKVLSQETSAPASVVSATISNLNWIELQTVKRLELLMLAEKLTNNLFLISKTPAPSAYTPIISVPVGKLSIAQKIINGLFDRGILAELIRSKAALDDNSYIRFLVTCNHTIKDIEHTSQAFSDVYKTANKIL